MPEIVKGNPVNDPTQKPVQNRSKFVPRYSLFSTHRFGLNTPHFAMAGVAGDKISMRCTADVDTYTLKSPLMQPIKRSHDYFAVPVRACLPNGGELLITNPVWGEDIRPELVNAVITEQVWSTYAANGHFNDFEEFVNNAHTREQWLAQLFNVFKFRSPWFSAGSLLKNLGYSLDKLFYVEMTKTQGASNERYDFDSYMELLLGLVASKLSSSSGYLTITLAKPEYVGNTNTLQWSSTKKTIYVSEANVRKLVTDSSWMNLRRFLSLLIESNWAVETVVVSTNALPAEVSGTNYALTLSGYYGQLFTATDILLAEDLNFLRVVAYQKSSAEFYTNDKVDAIYSARLWENNQMALAHIILGHSSRKINYTQNGVPIQYDSCAGAVLQDGFLNFCGCYQNGTLSSYYLAELYYFWNLLSMTRSLRYEDYFVGSRMNPLAVGDVTVGVDSQTVTVDVVDISKKIQVQRFLNQVNRVGRKFRDYVRGILGDTPAQDVHEPIFLGHITDTIGASETENTGAAQYTSENGITSKFRSNSQRFGFEITVKEPMVIIGITTYDIVRAYESVTEKENMHIDRYDAFNPYMQFVGDQKVLGAEIYPVADTDKAFGYQMRYAEYKQRVDQAAGAFAVAGILPGYARIIRSNELVDSTGKLAVTIGSDFIRSHVWELDEFYLSLSGFSMAHLFNFIVRQDNEVTCSRPMAFAPSIL